jgi:hypothetical protein
MSRRRILFNSCIFALALRAFSLDDLPVYFDAGCPNAGIPKSYAQGPADMNLPAGTGGKMIPITCSEALTGTDAMSIKLARSLANGEYWDFILKFADDTKKQMSVYKDLRFMIKNKIANPAKFRVTFDFVSGAWDSPSKKIEVSGNQNWTEIVIPLSEMGASAAQDWVYGVKLSNPIGQYNGPDMTAGPIDVLIDSMRITDGIGIGTIVYPTKPGGAIPSGWTKNFLVGTYDNYSTGQGTEKLQGKIDYRYQYVMHETWSWAADIGKTYSLESEGVGAKTGFVWYYLGKASESEVATNLGSETFMAGYFNEYDKLLDGMASAGQSDYIIVLEPDMYGLLMQGNRIKDMDGANVAVAMGQANKLSGKTYAATLTGWAQYMIARAKAKLPKGVIIGHMLNHWGVNIPGFIGHGRIEAHIIGALSQGNFLNSLGPGGKGDVVFVEKRDRDAGTAGAEWFWDSTNYQKYFFWTKLLSGRSDLRVVGWQVSEGNMSHPITANRDDAVQYFMDHPDQWENGGFIGNLFGPGMAGQADYKNDQGWFLNQMAAYKAKSYPLVAQPPVKRQAAQRSSCISGKSYANGYVFTGWLGKARLNLFDVAGKLFFSGSVEPGKKFSCSTMRGGIRVFTVKTATDFSTGMIEAVRH